MIWTGVTLVRPQFALLMLIVVVQRRHRVHVSTDTLNIREKIACKLRIYKKINKKINKKHQPVHLQLSVRGNTHLIPKKIRYRPLRF